MCNTNRPLLALSTAGLCLKDLSWLHHVALPPHISLQKLNTWYKLTEQPCICSARHHISCFPHLSQELLPLLVVLCWENWHGRYPRWHLAGGILRALVLGSRLACCSSRLLLAFTQSSSWPCRDFWCCHSGAWHILTCSLRNGFLQLPAVGVESQDQL